MEVESFESRGINNVSYRNALFNTGRFYNLNFQLEESNVYYERIIEIDSLDTYLGQSYAELGRYYYERADFFKSIEHYQKGIKVLENLQEVQAAAIHYLNLANSFYGIKTEKSLKNQLEALQKADSLSSIAYVGTRNYLNIIDGFANHYTSDLTYDFQKSRDYYFQNLDSAKFYNDSTSIARTYNNLSFLYNVEKNDSAVYFIEVGMAVVPKGIGESKLFENRAQYHIINNELNSAIKSINKAINIGLGVSKDIEVPSQILLDNSPFKYQVLNCLQKKIEILIRQYKQGGQINYLTSALENSKAADLLVDIIEDSSSERDSRLFWRKEASRIYLLGAYLSNLLGDTGSAFFFMEKNKALLLSEEIINNTSYAALPKIAYDLQTKQKKQIFALERKVEIEENKLRIEELKDSLFEAKRIYEKSLERLEDEYPEYFENQIQISPVSLTQAQSGLLENQVLISFIWNQMYDQSQSIIGLISNKNEARSFEVQHDQYFLSLLREYKKGVSKPFETKEDQESFRQTSRDLFNRLFPGEITDMLVNKHLIIVTDGDLQNISFDALIADKESNRYLIESSNIEYLYSVSFLNYNEDVRRTSNKRFIGYAPIDFIDSDLKSLSFTDAELSSIESTIGGHTRLNGKATKEHFLKNSGAYNLIHLATHASEEGSPWVSFADEKLELRELFNHKINAELVVLSACNTSLGEVAQGEGVLSLTRGFFYSGAKSVVSSLWSVNDKSTQEIMTDFYTNLKSGQSKSEALNNAKRSYLANHSLSELSPYYWSAFILVGDTEPVNFSNYQGWYIAMFALLFIFTIFLFRKKLSQ